MVGYADETMIYVVFPIPLSRLQLSDGIAKLGFSSNPHLVSEMAHKAKSYDKYTAVSWFRTYAAGYGDLTLGCAELEEVKNLRILGVIFDSKFTFETHLRKVVSKVA